MRIPLYQVDAFAERPFQGNPAAVCLLPEWIDGAVMQSIARENNLSETAFLVRRGADFAIRWFTPTREVDLCGHATLAAAFVLFEVLRIAETQILFSCSSGDLPVRRQGDRLVLDFPARPATPVEPPPALPAGLGAAPSEVLAAEDYLAVFEEEAVVRDLVPDVRRLLELDRRGVIVTAPGARVDFVSRFFAPKAGIPEDPVTGSSHCTLIPYWAGRLGKKRLHALQVSARGGELYGADRGERVEIAGRAAIYLEGRILLP